MSAKEVHSIAVWGSTASQVEVVANIVRAVGGWGIQPIQWPEGTAAHDVVAHVLHSGDSSNPPALDLVETLAGRSKQSPLIVIGSDPARAAAPTLWLPTTPSAQLLSAVLDHLVEPGGVSLPTLSWRRKTDMIIGNSRQIRQLLHTLDQLAPAQTPVIITGESGVGKELVARALHFCGPRAKAPFIPINCAAVPDNLFEAELFGYQRGAFTGAVNAHAGAVEAADQGTLFLDEIGEFPLMMQAKLLRVLETSTVQRIGSTEARKVNFRLVTATNRNLEDEVKAGRFREDLYYRIQVYPLFVAPLRERPEDIPPIATHHLSRIGIRENRPALRVTSGALEKMVAYDWPGNVRELVNLLERATLHAGSNVVGAEHIVLPQATRRTATASLVPYRDAKTRFERDYYSQLMRTADGNVSLAAKLGQKTRKEIYDALKRLGLEAIGFRGDDGSADDQ